VAGDDEILSALAPLNADQTLGRYELLTPIGRGGMAVVWAARLQGSRGFSKMVAIKVMLPHLSVDPRFERMFLREAKIASRIRHPNVCEITDLGEQDGVLYLVMEWVDGDSLAAVLRADPGLLPIDVAAHLVADAGRGLHAAHELTSEEGEHLSVVHRDVSPQNVLVTTSGTVQIVDFGVAKAANDGEQTTQSGFTKGKVGYVAPEQVNGAGVDARTDVFALGVVLYELTTRVHPFRGPTDLATLLAVASTDPLKDPTHVDPSYPPELAAIVRKAVEKDPEARYATMAEMVRELDAFVSAQPYADEIQARTRAALTTVLAASSENRARRLREAEAAFEERQRTRTRLRAGTETAAPRNKRAAIAVGSIVVAALAVGAIAGVRLSNSSARAEAQTVASPTPAGSAEIAPRAAASTPGPTGVVPSSAAPEPARSPEPSAQKRLPASGPRGARSPAPAAADAAPPAPPAQPAPSASSGPRFREPGF
jgi:eukaryotic-like serine/threonine-protein kinase